MLKINKLITEKVELFIDPQTSHTPQKLSYLHGNLKRMHFKSPYNKLLICVKDKD